MKIKPGMKLKMYNDGKVSPSREAVVVVQDVVRRDNLTKRQWSMWAKALREDIRDSMDSCVCVHYQCGRKFSATGWTRQFWDWNCQEFIVGKYLDLDGKTMTILFAKATFCSWYGVNANYMLWDKGKAPLK